MSLSFLMAGARLIALRSTRKRITNGFSFLLFVCLPLPLPPLCPNETLVFYKWNPPPPNEKDTNKINLRGIKIAHNLEDNDSFIIVTRIMLYEQKEKESETEGKKLLLDEENINDNGYLSTQFYAN